MTSLADVLPDYLAHCRRQGNARMTVEHKRTTLEQFIEVAGDLRVTEVRPRHVDRYFYALEQRGMSDSTLRSRYLSLSPFFKWVAREEGCKNPMADMVCPKVNARPRPVLAESVRQALKAETKPRQGRSRFLWLRDRALLAVLEDAGPRASEVVNIRLADVNLKARVILLRVTKGGDWRPMPLSPDTVPLLARYLAVRQQHAFADSERLWLGQRGPMGYHALYKVVKKAARRAGVIGVSPHVYRHTFAHEFLDRGGEEGALADLLGHASTDMVHKVYGRDMAQQRALKAADRVMGWQDGSPLTEREREAILSAERDAGKTVEHDLAKVGVAGSNPVVRSRAPAPARKQRKGRRPGA